MTYHEQARRDCLLALLENPILGDHRSHNDNDVPSQSNTVLPLTREYLQRLQNSRAGELSIPELQLLLKSKQEGPLFQTHLVSLGDLGRKDKDAGTTNCFRRAKEYLDGFLPSNSNAYEREGIPAYDIVTGNHDLEGLQEFDTDHKNLKAWMDCFQKSTPQFARYLGEKTLLLGLSTVRFRGAPYSPHEVYVDPPQVEWFKRMVETHPATEGWTILVFSHAPIIGSGLRVIQSVHVTSGCAWINHSSKPDERNCFIRIVKENPQIKCWASGHFHLSHEYQDSLTKIGSCTFVQVGVMGPLSSRDGRRQSRFFRGCGGNRIEILSINHHERVPIGNGEGSSAAWDERNETRARVRLDAVIDLETDTLVHASEEQSDETEFLPYSPLGRDQSWFRAYLPQEEDGCYLDASDGNSISKHTVCWWHMADGKVLGLQEGQLIEYDAETLAPLGVVLREDQIAEKEVLLAQNKTALVLVDDKLQEIRVIHPNSDGSYWRKFQNKKIGVEERAWKEVSRRWLK